MLAPLFLAALVQVPQTRPEARVARVSEPPHLDGILDDACWAQAGRLGELTEVDPNEGRPADPSTEVLLARDRDYLYLGITCMEPDPSGMVLQNMARDAFLRDDDRVEFVFDTFLDQKTGYFFQVSAAGSRGDALLGANGSSFNKRWDAFWEAEVHLGSDRWTVEVAIPFKTLAFGSGDRWGFNFSRYRGATRTSYRWASPRRDLRVMVLSNAGILQGMADAEQGLGIEFVPYFKVRRSEFESPDRQNLLGIEGGEFNWRVTPQLTASLTFNTDFAETEADQRRVNLTRFPLFFPEKRDFFLEDSNLFDFGQQSGFRGSSDLLPYFSRRIGLANGAEIPLNAGARVAGRVGNLDLGLLAVSAGENLGAGVPASQLFVLRPSYNLSDELSVGALYTSGDPEADTSNQVMGGDLRFSRTDFLPGYRLNLNTYLVRSSDEAIHAVGGAWGIDSSLVSRDTSFSFNTLSTQSDFRPALGFVRRPGERRFRFEARWEPRPDSGPIRKFIFAFRPLWWTDLGGQVQSHGVDLTFFGMEFHSGDRMTLRWAFDGDRLDGSFSPVTGTTIAPGYYHWNVLEADFRSSNARVVSLRSQLRVGQWYDGQALRGSLACDWRPDAHFRLGVSWNEDRFDLPGGDFISRIGIVNLDYSFSPLLTIQNLIQGDNQSDVIGWQSRLHWLLEDGREAFLVLNDAWQELPNGPYVPLDRDLTLKLVYSLRF